jgi:tripartite-type tricarboxylate transporter receptor subunit TctC
MARGCKYDALKDFTPLTLAVKYTNVLVVHPAVAAKDVGELVAYAKSNPGQGHVRLGRETGRPTISRAKC